MEAGAEEKVGDRVVGVGMSMVAKAVMVANAETVAAIEEELMMLPQLPAMIVSGDDPAHCEAHRALKVHRAVPLKLMLVVVATAKQRWVLMAWPLANPSVALH